MSANVLHLTSLQKSGLYSFAAANVRNLRRLELASRPHRSAPAAMRRIFAFCALRSARGSFLAKTSRGSICCGMSPV